MSDQKQPTKPETPKKDAGQIFLEEVTREPPRHLPRWRRMLQAAVIPVLAIFTGMVMGGVIIILTTPEVYAAFRESVWLGLKAAWDAVATNLPHVAARAAHAQPLGLRLDAELVAYTQTWIT